MANGVSGSVSATSGGYTIRIYYQETYTTSTNKTDTFRITKIGITSNNRSDACWFNGKIKVNGTTVVSEYGSVYGDVASGYASGTYIYEVSAGTEGTLYRQNSNDTWSQITGQVSNIAHNDDGTKNITIAIEDVELVSVDSSTWRVSNWDRSWNVALTSIPRAATISTASNTTLGNGCTITWTSKASSYYYRVRLEIGSWVWVSAVGAIAHQSSTSYSYTTPPLALNIADQLPNATSGTLTVYLYTYSDSGCTRQVGSRQSKNITVTVPSDMIPTLDSLQMDLVNTNQQLATWDVGVIGKTAVRLRATATGVHSSTIKKFVISNAYSANVNGASLDKTIYANEITTRGNKIFTVKAVDSRSRNSTTLSTTQVYFYEYSDPTIDTLEIARDDSDNTQINIKAIWSYSSIGGRNSATARLRYKANDSSSWTEYSGVIIQGTAFSISGFDEDKSYNFQLIVEDAIDSSVVQEIFIPTIAVTLDLRAGGKGIAFGKICESNNFEVGMDTIFMGDVYIETDPVTKAKITLEAYIQQVVAAMNNS